MTEIYFLRTRHVYDSYTDFWRLVELSGFPTLYTDELRLDQEGVYITAPYNGEHKPHIENETGRLKELGLPRLAHTILWNLERPSGSGFRAEYIRSNRQHVNELLFDEIWVSDARLADDTQFRFVVLGSDYGLGEPGKHKTYSFCHMSAPTPRRTTIYSRFPADSIGPNCWPKEQAEEPDKYLNKRDEVLKKSRFALNIHQDNYPYQEPLRFALFAAYGLPLVSETCFNAFPLGADDHLSVSYEGVVGSMKQALQDPYDRWEKMGAALREKLCNEYQFGKMVRQAVDLSEAASGWR